jgi:hypothetical protein
MGSCPIIRSEEEIRHDGEGRRCPTFRGRRTDRALAQVKKALLALRFGEIVLTVQDGLVIQLQRTERIRLPRARRR